MIPMKAKPKIVPPDAGKALNVLGHVVTTVVVGADTGGAYAALYQEAQPGHGPPLHRHSREDEGFTVLAGTYEFRVGEETFALAPERLSLGRGASRTPSSASAQGPARFRSSVAHLGSRSFSWSWTG
jgi:quercetin dioxygenase-like cupin family protein